MYLSSSDLRNDNWYQDSQGGCSTFLAGGQKLQVSYYIYLFYYRYTLAFQRSQRWSTRFIFDSTIAVQILWIYTTNCWPKSTKPAGNRVDCQATNFERYETERSYSSTVYTSQMSLPSTRQGFYWLCQRWGKSFQDANNQLTKNAPNISVHRDLNFEQVFFFRY